ncbi:MAG: hypothetical protein ACOC12_04825 [Bacteroidota bacterium]
MLKHFTTKQQNQLILPRIVCMLLLAGSFFTGRAQENTFSETNDEEFFNHLSYITQNLEREDRLEADALLDSLRVLWTTDSVFFDYKDYVINTLEGIQPLRLRPWPEQALYLKGVLAVWNTKQALTNFEVWHRSFQPLMTLQNQKKLLRFWEASLHLFEERILFQSNVVKWQLKDDNYRLKDEEGGISRIIFGQSDIICFAQDDSTVIYNTQGEVDMLEEKLYGKQGRVTWERVGLHPDTVFAELSVYTISLPTARWDADSVTFSNRDYFAEPLLGKLTERIVAEVNAQTARYPRFESYQAVHEITDLFPGIDFRGGFTMAGARVLGSGTADGDAVINIYRADSLFITARGRNFNILSDRIITQRAAVSIYLSGDSIHHPNINMRYLNPEREFSLLRDEKGFSKAPFSSSFHKLNMYCEAIYWNIDTDQIDFRMIRGISETGQAYFESYDYFSDVKYMRMQGMSQLHPLIRLRNFARVYHSNTFPVSEYAKEIRADVASVSSQLLNFSQDGFLTYHDNETVTLNEKLFHYIASYAGRSDFDVISINSEAPVNAKLNMNNFDLHLHGVERIPLSNQKNVVLHPSSREVIVKKNRDIYFDGRIESGLFDFYGREFFFDYDLFKIELLQTDSMSFRVRSFEPDSRGQYSLVRVKTVLEGINGELLVDHPRNKSGQLPYPRFPIFNSNNESFVFYDRDFVQEGVYKRDDVYFKLIPFSIDSLDNATTDNIAFDGVFISTGIFPDFYDYLMVQPDYSLGFNTKTPDEGYTVYDGKAVYRGPINMSYEGLRTDGELQYLNSTVHANRMVMFPDSARAMVNTFTLNAQDAPVEYPEFNARDVDMLYLPHQDDMTLTSIDKPFDIYGGIAMLKGSATLTPEGISGKGELEFFGATLASEDFDFKLNDLAAEKIDLTVLTPDKENNAFTAQNYSTYVDFENMKTELSTIGNESKLDFELNRFHAFGFNIDWDMNSGDIVMENQYNSEVALTGITQPEHWIDFDFKGNELISSHPAQDSLRFFAGRIDYKLAENIIEASQVKIIKVADAAIFPHEEKVDILARAEIAKLEQAQVIANTTSRLHQFYDADINIVSRWDYSGNGLYDYTDAEGNVQTLTFGSVAVDRAYRTTIAKAEVEKEQDFTISPRFGFFGEVNLKAESPNFAYAGATTMFVDCPLYEPNWFRFEAEINKDSIFIPLAEELRNDANGPIITSIMMGGEEAEIYAGVFDRQKHYSDFPIIAATGHLTWDDVVKQYKVSTLEKLQKPSLPDNIITINPATCIIEGQGDINLSQEMGQFKMVTYGRITHDLNVNGVSLDIIMGLDFFFLEPALALIEQNLNESENGELLNINRSKYVKFLHKKTGEQTAQRLMEEYAADGAFRRFPDELNHTFFFADLKMKWNQNLRTFHTTGPLGIGNMERYPMNRYVPGYLEINKNRGGDVFNMVLVPSDFADEGIGTEWFFFTYSQEIMQSIAANTDYNDMIRSVNPRRRRMEVERGEKPFVFVLASDRRPFDFVRNMRMLSTD